MLVVAQRPEPAPIAQTDLSAFASTKAAEPKCRTCEGMRDFVSQLQGEIRRLQFVTKDLTMQLVKAGGTPDQFMFSKFQNVCPACTKLKQQQRPGSASAVAKRAAPENTDFRIRKASNVGKELAARRPSNITLAPLKVVTSPTGALYKA